MYSKIQPVTAEKSANVEGVQIAPTRNANKNAILTANRVRFAKRPMKMKNHVFRKWPVPAVKVPMWRVPRFRKKACTVRKRKNRSEMTDPWKMLKIHWDLQAKTEAYKTAVK